MGNTCARARPPGPTATPPEKSLTKCSFCRSQCPATQLLAHLKGSPSGGERRCFLTLGVAPADHDMDLDTLVPLLGGGPAPFLGLAGLYMETSSVRAV